MSDLERLQHLARYVDASIRERGMAYFRANRVTLEYVDGDSLRASVMGSRRYPVVLELDVPRMFAGCRCAHFNRELTICKHIWATVLEAVDIGELDPAPFKSLMADEVDFLPEPDVWTPAGRGRGEVEAPWRSFFRALNFPSYDYARPDASPPIRGELLYVVHATRDVVPRIALEILVRVPKKNGELGSPRPIAPTARQIAELPEPHRELLSLIEGEYSASSTFLGEPRIHVLLPRLARSGHLYIQTQGKTLRGPLIWDGAAWSFEVAIRSGEEKFHGEGRFVSGERIIPVDEALLVTSTGWFVTAATVARFSGEAVEWLAAFRSKRTLEVPLADREMFVESLAAAPAVRLELPPELGLTDAPPRPLLRFERERTESWKAYLFARYGHELVRPASVDAARVGDTVVRRRRDVESDFVRRLSALPFRSSGIDVYHLAAADLPATLSALAEDEWELEFGSERLELEGELELEVSSGIDWFDVDGAADFNGKRVALPRLLEAMRRNEMLVPLEGGGVGLIPAEWNERLAELETSGKEHGESLRFSRNQATLIDALLAARGQTAFDSDFEKLRERLRSTEAIAPRHEPEGFGAELRPYQRAGLGWLWFLREVRFGGCLADDMGLGKTVQALALLEEIRRSEGERRPSLVVAPRSLMFNWKAEAARFAPEMRVLDHHGLERIRGASHFDEYDLILTTYGTLQRDIAHLASPEFEYVILDEAQAIKNADSQTARAVRTLRARHRLALSGTPIENHVGELWSLFEFLNPGMLGSRRTFARGMGAKSAPLAAREKLARVVRPFILRRTKTMVLSELPAKTEETLWVELSERERAEYDELREHYRTALLKQVAEDGVAKSRMQILEALLRLRQAALHPALIDPSRSGESSAKLEALDAELSVLLEGEHKVLVFSQFTRLLDVVENRLSAAGTGYRRLDGRSRNREALVADFQERDDVRVFLISLRAGGVGLNLTAADYVFLLDPWWNPAVEAQAIDRAHRIGQQRSVFATRIVASDTVEEKILQLQERKRELADSIIRADESFSGGLDLDDLEMLLS